MNRLVLIPVFLVTASFLCADVPVRQEQLIYSVWAFNGRDYAGTFSGEDSNTIYLLAETDNFVSVRKTLVYYWEATQEPRTDTSTLNKEFDGSLEVTARGIVPRTIPVTDYTYYNVRGDYELNWKVDTGAAAHATHQRYTDLVDAHYERTANHQRESAAYERRMRELVAEITQLRKAGKNFDDLLETAQSMKAPVAPQFPRIFMVPPAPVQKAHILNLPEGEYDIRFVLEDGSVMEGSERRIICFKKRRDEGVGLEVIPGDRWTRVEESKTPASVLYVNGSADLYLRAFYQNEFNDLFFEKLRNNNAKGNPNLMKWVRIQQVPKARIELTDPEGGTKRISENPFYVEQARGTALGYTIAPYDPEGTHKGSNPNLIAFHVPLMSGADMYRVSLRDMEGNHLAGSDRQIRVVPGSELNIIPVLIVLLPIVVMVLVQIYRTRRYTE